MNLNPSVRKRLREQPRNRLLKAHRDGLDWDHYGSLEFDSELRDLARDLLGMSDPSGLWLASLRLEVCEELLYQTEEALGEAYRLLSASEEDASQTKALSLLEPFASGWQR